jgi:hypothetical protein
MALAFDLATPHGRMIATVLAGIAEFERTPCVVLAFHSRSPVNALERTGAQGS